MAEIRACEYCGVAFEPRREHARFCSADCRVAWNRENAGYEGAGDSALGWAIIGMRDNSQRLGRVRPRDRPQAFAVISEAVWWVTIVDATLVRYHPAEYDAVMAGLTPAERQLTEGTFAGLRFVRNRMGYYVDHADFVQPGQTAAGLPDAPVAGWIWKPVPKPALGTLPPRGQAWEMSRYWSYQAALAGHTIGETFGRATRFLDLACASVAADAGAQAAP